MAHGVFRFTLTFLWQMRDQVDAHLGITAVLMGRDVLEPGRPWQVCALSIDELSGGEFTQIGLGQLSLRPGTATVIKTSHYAGESLARLLRDGNSRIEAMDQNFPSGHIEVDFDNDQKKKGSWRVRLGRAAFDDSLNFSSLEGYVRAARVARERVSAMEICSRL